MSLTSSRGSAPDFRYCPRCARTRLVMLDDRMDNGTFTKIKAWHDRVFADMVIEQVQTVQEREAMK